MPLDSNGIWQYTEGETAAPFSTLLNRLASSVSSKLAGYVGKGTTTTIQNQSGSTVVTGYPCQVVRIGAFYFAWGRWTRTSSSATQVWGTLPGTEFNPPRVLEVGDFYSSGSTTRCFIGTSGEVTTQGTPAGSSTFGFQAMWPAVAL